MSDERLSEAVLDEIEATMAALYPTGIAAWALRAIRQLRADLAAALDQAHGATADLSRAAEAAGLAPYGGAWNPEALVPAIMSLREKAEQFDTGVCRPTYKPLPSPTWEDDR